MGHEMGRREAVWSICKRKLDLTDTPDRFQALPGIKTALQDRKINVLRYLIVWYESFLFRGHFGVDWGLLRGRFGGLKGGLEGVISCISYIRKMLMNRVAIRALELILCRLRAMLQGYLFMHLACLQEPSKTHLKPIL